MSSEFRHEDFNNSDEYEEVDLRKDNNINQCSFVYVILRKVFQSSMYIIRLLIRILCILNQCLLKHFSLISLPTGEVSPSKQAHEAQS